jgi:hypothetical protein
MSKIFNFNSKKVAFATLFAVSAVFLGVTGLHKVEAGYVQDCKWNSIIKCGEPTPSAFISQVRANNDKQGHHDLQAIYSDFGLVPSDYSKFVSYARMGMAYQDGTIKVDGQTVATDAWSIGRQHFSYASPITIAGKTYYKAADKQVLLQNLPVMVMFNNKGVMQFAAMTACGNPVAGKNVAPKYSCDLLQKTAVSGKKNTYAFSTKATATNNAKLVKAVYDFGDGTSVTETNLSTQVQHTYTKAGTYTAKVTVYVSLPGKQTVTVTSANCETQIIIAAPYQSCVALDAEVVDNQARQFRFTVTSNQGNGSVLQSADFDFGDGNSTNGATPTTDKTVVANHTYDQAGKYTITAVVHFNTPGGEQSVSCVTNINITQKMCAINPSVPENSPECKPCQYNHNIPANSAACVPPTITTTAKVLPNTGPGSAAALFAGATIVGGLAYRLFLTRRIKREM